MIGGCTGDGVCERGDIITNASRVEANATIITTSVFPFMCVDILVEEQNVIRNHAKLLA